MKRGFWPGAEWAQKSILRAFGVLGSRHATSERNIGLQVLLTRLQAFCECYGFLNCRFGREVVV